MNCRGCSSIYFRPVSYVSLLLTLIVVMLALCTSSWYSLEYSTNENGKNSTQIKHIGLWNVCSGKSYYTSSCSFLPKNTNATSTYRVDEDHLTVVRALYSMTVMLLLGALGYPPFFKQMSTGILKIGFMSVLTIVGGEAYCACSFAAMLTMTHQINSLSAVVTFGYSYILGWVGTGQSFVTAGLIYIASKDVYIDKIYSS